MFESNYNYVPNPYPPAPPAGYYPPVPPAPPMPPGPPMPGPAYPIYVDPTLSVPGAAADAHVTGKLLAAKLDLENLSGNIQLINDKLELSGLLDAESGQVPSKGEDNQLVWITAVTESEFIREKNLLQTQINNLSSSVDYASTKLNDLISHNVSQDYDIATLKMLINGDSDTPGISQRIDSLESSVESLINDLSQKLDASTFDNFLETVINGENGLIQRLVELEGCCEAVNADIQDIHNQLQSHNDVLFGEDGSPDNYDQPIYMTLNELKDMDIDGGDLDEEVEP